MFELNKQKAKVTNVNTRVEFCGDEKRLGCDVKLKFTTSNEALDMFDPELRTKFFKEKPKEEEDLADQGTDEKFVCLRFPDLQKKMKWDYVGAGYRMEINIGVTGESNIYMINTQLSKFSFELKDGGSVEIEFNVSGNPTDEEIGRLAALLKLESVDLTLEPPSPKIVTGKH